MVPSVTSRPEDPRAQVRQLSARELAAEYAAGTPFDVTVCVTEPIHLLGGVQPYGALIAVGGNDLVIRVVSGNVDEVLGVGPAGVHGRPLASVLGADRADQIGRAAAGLPADAATVLSVNVVVRAVDTRFDVTLHRVDDLVVCEFEPGAGGDPVRSSVFPPVRASMRRMQAADTVAGLCAVAAQEVRALTGYDRVVVYRFDGDGPGEVVAEEVRRDWESWLGLWFPASDVPPQARRLYLRHWIRTIADVDDARVTLDPPVLPGTGRPLDLSGSVLRTVSEYHLDYLRNIRVRASMSVSLIQDDRLWGLIACHHGEPRRLSPEQRAACEFLGATLSLQLVRIEERERAAALAGARAVLNRLTEAMATEFPDGLLHGTPNLTDLIAADGVYLSLGDVALTSGAVPPAADRAAIQDAMGTPVRSGAAWSTDRLGEATPALAGLSALACGVLVLPLNEAGDVIMWFRTERRHALRWAIDPNRPIVTAGDGARLSPRGSSMVWHETVRGRSEAWSEIDHEVATELWRSVVEVELRRATRLADLNRALTRSNTDLDAFAYSVSHDLKEPLRGIANFATFLLEDNTGTLDEQSQRRLKTVRRLAARMDDLLNSLLHFSQLGHADLATEMVEVDGCLDEVVDMLADRFVGARVELRRPMPLPPAHVDRVLVQEVLTNLLTNAIKYAGSPPRWVEVGHAAATPPGGPRPEPAFYVRDNGVGVSEEFHEEIFKVFRRLQQGTTGTGVGLSVARRIVERHGGALWVESGRGEGSTFWFTLPAGRGSASS